MDLVIQSLGFYSGTALDNFIIEKVAGLKAENVIRANVTLYKGLASKAETGYCEIQLEMLGNDLLVKKQGTRVEDTVNECVEVLSQMINKTKGKIASRYIEKNLIYDTLVVAS